MSDDTTSTYGRVTLPLSKFDGWELDVYVSHANGLWPCVDAAGDGIANLLIPVYNSGRAYVVRADYVPNSHNEYFFNSTLVVVS